MEINRIKTYNITVTHDELLLISKALGGRLEKQVHIHDAKLLDKVIGEWRVDSADREMIELNKLADCLNIESEARIHRPDDH